VNKGSRIHTTVLLPLLAEVHKARSASRIMLCDFELRFIDGVASFGTGALSSARSPTSYCIASFPSARQTRKRAGLTDSEGDDFAQGLVKHNFLLSDPFHSLFSTVHTACILVNLSGSKYNMLILV